MREIEVSWILVVFRAAEKWSGTNRARQALVHVAIETGWLLVPGPFFFRGDKGLSAACRPWNSGICSQLRPYIGKICVGFMHHTSESNSHDFTPRFSGAPHIPAKYGHWAWFNGTDVIVGEGASGESGAHGTAMAWHSESPAF